MKGPARCQCFSCSVGSFPSTLHACCIFAATGGCSRLQDLQERCSPIPIFTGIPLPVPLSCGEIHPCGAWAGPSLCQHSHLGPNQGLTAPLSTHACHPNGEQEEAGPRVQECGHSPHLGRAVLGGASGCLEPLPWIHVELIGQEDAGCPASGGSEASMWCFCNTAHPPQPYTQTHCSLLSQAWLQPGLDSIQSEVDPN